MLPRFLAFPSLALVLFVSSAAGAEGPSTPERTGKARSPTTTARSPRTAHVQKATSPATPRQCMKAPVVITTGQETASFSLARCDGTTAPLAVEQLSILARPPSAAPPRETLEMYAKKAGPELAPGVRRIDPRLVERLEAVVEHFRREGAPARVDLVSGYRPRSPHSLHHLGRALDFRVDGVENEALVAFCKTLPDTGCGFYPNSVFVHMDVRNPGAGHLAWIDASRPGEPARYVPAWPLPPSGSSSSPPGALPPLPEAPRPEQEPRDLSARPSVRQGRTYFF